MLFNQILRASATKAALQRTYATATGATAGTTAASAIRAKPPRKIGAFRGGFMGFLLGVTITGFGSYYYLIDEYRAANKAIVGDLLALEKTIGSLEQHVRFLENKVK